MQPSIVPESQLVRSSQEGDKAAFGQLVTLYQNLVCSVAYSRCGDLGMSEDLAQEAFVQAWSKLKDLKDVASFKAWLCTIVRNLATRATKKRSRNIVSHSAPLDNIAELSSAEVGPAETIASAEQEEVVWGALAEIPENYREPMILFYRESQSVARVATALDISQDTVKQRLSRGRKLLHQQLVQTVENVLEESGPSSQFSAGVMLGISNAALKTSAMAATSGAAKVVAASKAAGVFGLPLLHLPVIAWLTKQAMSETRSKRERGLVVRYLFVSFLGIFAVFGGLLAGMYFIPWPSRLAWIQPVMAQIICSIAVVIGARVLGKRIKQLRSEEGTETSTRSVFREHEGSKQRVALFVGSGLLVAAWPAVFLFHAGIWAVPLGVLAFSVSISCVASLWRNAANEKAYRAFVFSNAIVVFASILVLYFSMSELKGGKRDHLFGFALALQGSGLTLAVMIALAWKRVYGKPRK